MKVLLVLSMGLAIVFWFYMVKKKEAKIIEKLEDLKSNTGELKVDDFLELRKAAGKDFTGIYIIKNVDKNMYYVGQSVRVLNRVCIHLTGNGGNGDVYADYKAGDHFTITCYSLARSGYDSLDDLERDFITKLDAYKHGYNKNQGNSNRR